MDEINVVQRYIPDNEDARQSTPYICTNHCYPHRMSTRILQLYHRDGVAH
jgi:hypothetical protein